MRGIFAAIVVFSFCTAGAVAGRQASPTELGRRLCAAMGECVRHRCANLDALAADPSLASEAPVIERFATSGALDERRLIAYPLAEQPRLEFAAILARQLDDPDPSVADLAMRVLARSYRADDVRPAASVLVPAVVAYQRLRSRQIYAESVLFSGNFAGDDAARAQLVALRGELPNERSSFVLVRAAAPATFLVDLALSERVAPTTRARGDACAPSRNAHFAA